MAEKSRADLVAEVMEQYGGYRRSTATGGSTSTVVDTADLLEPDEYWIGLFCFIVTDAGGAHAAPEGEERPVTDYVQSTGTLTVAPVFTAGVANGDTYELLPVRRDVVERAINAGVREAGLAWPVFKVDDATVAIADDDYDYDLPADLAELLRVLTRDDTDEPWVEVAGRLWGVSKTPGGQELVLDALADFGDGDLIRLEYLARPSELATDAGTLGVGEPAEVELVEFVVNWALYYLHNRAGSRKPTGGEFRAHITQAEYHKGLAMAKKQKARRHGRRGTVRTKRWARHRG